MGVFQFVLGQPDITSGHPYPTYLALNKVSLSVSDSGAPDGDLQAVVTMLHLKHICLHVPAMGIETVQQGNL